LDDEAFVCAALPDRRIEAAAHPGGARITVKSGAKWPTLGRTTKSVPASTLPKTMAKMT
jgi:hypothetical protein